jgi:DNA-binding MarR family transcriptional regulator
MLNFDRVLIMSGIRSSSPRTSRRSSPPLAGQAASARSVKAAPPTPLLQELAQTFFQLMMRHRVAVRDVIVESGLSPPLVMTMHMLEGPPLTMRELADMIGLEPSNLTAVVDKLEARGYVERQSSPTDRRIKRVALTRSGRVVRKRLLERLKQPAGWMAGLDAKDQEQLLQILQRALTDASLPEAQPRPQLAASSQSTQNTKTRKPRR